MKEEITIRVSRRRNASKPGEFLFSVEEAQQKITCGLRALCCVQDAMERGERSCAEYAEAVYSVWENLTDWNDALGRVVEAEFERNKGNG